MAEIYETYLPNWVRKMRLDPEDAREALQVTFEGCGRAHPEMFRDDAFPVDYVFVSFVRAYRRIREQKGYRPTFSDVAPEGEFDPVEPRASTPLQQLELAELLDQLPERVAEPLRLALAGYQHDEIAVKLKRPTGTVSRQISEARQFLRKAEG